MASQNTPQILSFSYNGVKTLTVNANSSDIKVVPVVYDEEDENWTNQIRVPKKMTSNITALIYCCNNIIALYLKRNNDERYLDMVIIEFDDKPNLESYEVKIHMSRKEPLVLIIGNKPITSNASNFDVKDNMLAFVNDYWAFYYSEDNKVFTMEYVPGGPEITKKPRVYIGGTENTNQTSLDEPNYGLLTRFNFKILEAIPKYWALIKSWIMSVIPYDYVDRTNNKEIDV